MQVGLVFPTQFKVVVDKVIRTCMSMTVEDHRVSRDELGETAGRCFGFFYANNVMVRSCKSDWLQHAMNVPVGLLRRYLLAANFAKLRTITCKPRALRAGMPEEDMALKCTGVRDSYQVRLQSWIP